VKGLVPSPGAVVHLDDAHWHLVGFLALLSRFAERAA
jgi:hypothetical protein